VEGCSGSLKALKEYHQRYKICEYHLKVTSIIREGVRQRFCQQCGRFHDLSEFDGDKRSCRARLQVRCYDEHVQPATTFFCQSMHNKHKAGLLPSDCPPSLAALAYQHHQ